MKVFRKLRVLLLAPVLALLAVVLMAAPALGAPAISLSTTSGATGTSVTVTLTGFTASQTINIYYDSSLQTSVSSGSGNTTASITIPESVAGGHTIRAQNTTNTTEDVSTTFTVTPRITLDYTSGVVGDTIKVSGTGYGASRTVTLYFNDVELNSTSANGVGSFSNLSFTVPASSHGTHTVRVKDSADNTYSTSFSTEQKMSLSPSSGAVGSQVTVTGTGFSGNVEAYVYFDGTRVTTSPATVSTASNGNVSCTFAVPKSARGDHTVKLIDYNDNSYSVTFSTQQSITLNPTTGIVGSQSSVTGNGFLSGTAITVTFDGLQVTTTPETVTSDSEGGVTASFKVPAFSAGSHQVRVSDGTNSDTKSFTITATASLSQTSGYTGDKVTVTGSGFGANQQVAISFDTTVVKSGVADNTGKVNIVFDVPDIDPGVHKVRITDMTNTIDINFTTQTSAVINPVTSAASAGFVGQSVVISGTGFTPGKTVTVTYDGTQIGTATVGTDRAFSVSVKIPASKAGQHNIIATDGTATRRFVFYMDATAPAAPSLLTPANDTKAKAQPDFTWNQGADR